MIFFFFSLSKEYRKMIIKRCLVISFLVIFLTLAIFGTVFPISRSLSQLYSRNITVFNPLPNADNIIKLTQVNGGPAKELQLSAMTSEKDESLHVMSVYNLKKPKITWSNLTISTTLDNHPLQPYYALPGSVVTFNISSINFEEEEEEDVSFTLQLLNEVGNSLCKKTFKVEFPVNNNDSLNIIHTCVISETDYYRVWYNGKGSAEAIMTYDTLVLDVTGLDSTCHLNEYTNCTLFPSFREKSFVILKFNIEYSTFTVQVVYIPRTELYFFVLISIAFVAAVFGLIICGYFSICYIRKKGKVCVFLKSIKH